MVGAGLLRTLKLSCEIKSDFFSESRPSWQAESSIGPAPEGTLEAPKTKAKAKKPAMPKVKRPRKVKAPPRQRARWGIFDASMKQVAVFDYNQRIAAGEKLAHLLATKKGTHFMQIVKDAMPEPVVEAALAV
jgi:hypothetical protein